MLSLRCCHFSEVGCQSYRCLWVMHLFSHSLTIFLFIVSSSAVPLMSSYYTFLFVYCTWGFADQYLSSILICLLSIWIWAVQKLSFTCKIPIIHILGTWKYISYIFAISYASSLYSCFDLNAFIALLIVQQSFLHLFPVVQFVLLYFSVSEYSLNFT